MNKIKEAWINGLDILEISTLPNFVIVKIIYQENNKIRDKSDFPSEFNLNEDPDDHCILFPLMLKIKLWSILLALFKIINRLSRQMKLPVDKKN